MEKTKIIFIEPCEAAFQFRKCMAQVMQSLPPIEMAHAKDASSALDIIEEEGADVIVVNDDLQDELEVILDSIDNKEFPVLVQSDVQESFEANKILYIERKNIKVIPKEETLDHLHKTLIAATNHKGIGADVGLLH